jgi:hypothetical protein
MAAKEAKRCSTGTLVGLSIGAVVALVAACYTGPKAYDSDLIRYTFGDQSIKTPDHHTLPWDLLFITCYGMFLCLCATIVRKLVISNFGRLFAQLLLAATAVTIAADLIEDAALWGTPRWDWLALAWKWQEVADAAATAKWCAALIAAMSVPAAVVVLVRLAKANLGFARRNRDPKTGNSWWNSVLAIADAPTTSDDVLRRQGSWIKAYRVPGTAEVLEKNNKRGQPTTAICLSGGGVRSACVAMGATQEFAKRGHRDKANLLDNVDYIISVSGGGYTAGARLLATQPQDQCPTLPTRPPTAAGAPFPLPLSSRYSEGSLEFDYFRRHSSYIADSPSGMVRALAVVFKNLLASLVALFWVPVAIGFAAGLLYAWLPVAFLVPVSVSGGARDGHYVLASVGNDVAWWAVVFFVGWAVLFQIGALLVEWWRVDERGEGWRSRLLSCTNGAAVFAGITFGVTIAIPALMRLGNAWFLELPTSGKVGGVAGVVGLQYLASVAAMAWKKKGAAPGGGISGWTKRLPRAVFQYIMIVLTLAVLAALWLIVFGAVAAYVFKHTVGKQGFHSLMAVPHWWVWLVVIGALAAMLGIADVTSLSLHPFYRGRLARTFAVRRLQIRNKQKEKMNRWKAERYAAKEPTWLDSYGTVKAVDEAGNFTVDPTAPKFVFAAAVPISGDEKPAPGLNAVSFVLTADYMGGPELGWLKTPEMIRVAPPRVRRDLTVQAAVAISGAAFASAMGRQSSWASTLLAVSGARLGTWLPNPFFVRMLANEVDDDAPTVKVAEGAIPGVDAEGRKRDRDTLSADMESATTATAARTDEVAARDKLTVWPKGLPTLRGSGYLYRELLGLHKKVGRLIQVTDGGHYENLGLVEALRRRCQLIYCVDASGDTPPLVTGLADAVRLAEYELGVIIKVRDTEPNDYSLANLAPGSGEQFIEPDAFVSINKRITRNAVLVADITYPEAAGLDARRSQGVLIIAKAVLWHNCPQWLLTYAAAKENEIFPHDPTSDQWFNEAQFSAYTELGRLIGASALDVGEAEYGELVARYRPSQPTPPPPSTNGQVEELAVAGHDVVGADTGRGVWGTGSSAAG